MPDRGLLFCVPGAQMHPNKAYRRPNTGSGVNEHKCVNKACCEDLVTPGPEIIN